MIVPMYQCQRTPRSEWLAVRSLRYHLLSWGDLPGANRGSTTPPLVLLHGWMDVGASWQFMVDALSEAFMQGRRVLAADWRGFGQTASPGADCYWFPDYMADLDFLLDRVSPDRAVDLVGHSMGGNVAMMYAGARPQRVRRLVNVEGFGLPGTLPEHAPARQARWMDELKSLHRGELALSHYPSLEGVARRLMKTNPRLGQDKADWLAQRWARPLAQADGSTHWQIQGDAAHKIVSANLYQEQETLAAYRCISAPVLAVETGGASASLAHWYHGRFGLEQYHERLKALADCRVERIEDAGHMVQHDQPEQLARLIEGFVA